MVYGFGTIQLQCGNASWGYNHVKARHYNEFQGLARAGGLNWSVVVDGPMHQIALVNDDAGVGTGSLPSMPRPAPLNCTTTIEPFASHYR